MGQEPRPGATAGDCVIGRRGGDDRVAGTARQLLANVPHHFEPSRQVIEGLADILADAAQCAAAARAGAAGRMHHLFARQMLGQRTTGRLLRFGHILGDRRGLGRGGRQPLGLVALQGLDRQLELLGLAFQLLRGAAELGPPIARQLELQPGDLSPRRHRLARHLGDDPLQRGDVVGQGFRGRHGPDYLISPRRDPAQP
jgi:hypothetical protein